jgi:hypothetical protein
MALTKTAGSITQLTATGASTTLDVEASYEHSLYVVHVNGSGSITAQATIQVQARPKSSSTWYSLGGPLGGGVTASATRSWTVPLPPDATEVRLSYTAPTGSSGHTLDAEVGRVTGV